MGHPACSRLHPILVQAFQLVLELHLPGRSEAQGRVLELEVGVTGGQRLIGPDRLSVRQNALDDDGRNHGIR